MHLGVIWRKSNSRHNISKVKIILWGIVLLGIIVSYLWFSPSRYVSRIFHFDIPLNARNVKVTRTGLDTPRVEFNLSKQDFSEFKKITINCGYEDWKIESYDASGGGSFLQNATIAGFSMGNSAYFENCDVTKGRSHFRLYYDYNSELFIAIEFFN